MNVKLTKKDKVMLLILLTVIIVAVFFMYGIMPMQNKSKELDTTIADKQAKVAELNETIKGLNAKAPTKAKREALLHYYKNKDDLKYMHAVLEGTFLDRYVSGILDSYNIEGYSTIGWASTTSTPVDAQFQSQALPDPIQVTTVTEVANINIVFQVKSKEDFYKLVDEFRRNPDFTITTMSITVNEKELPEEETTPDPAPGGGTSPDPAPTPDPTPNPPTEEKPFYPYEGGLTVRFVMGNKYEGSKELKIPSLMDDVQGLAQKTGTTDTIIFNNIEDAKSYDFYMFIVEEGKRKYKKIDTVSYRVDDKTGKVEAKLIGVTKGTNVAVAAVGDYVNYFETMLDNSSPSVTLA